MSCFPYHFCLFPGCTEMTPPHVLRCERHAADYAEALRRADESLNASEDEFFPMIEDDLMPNAGADAAQQPTTATNPVRSDAGLQKESHD